MGCFADPGCPIGCEVGRIRRWHVDRNVLEWFSFSLEVDDRVLEKAEGSFVVSSWAVMTIRLAASCYSSALGEACVGSPAMPMRAVQRGIWARIDFQWRLRQSC